MERALEDRLEALRRAPQEPERWVALAREVLRLRTTVPLGPGKRLTLAKLQARYPQERSLAYLLVSLLGLDPEPARGPDAARPPGAWGPAGRARLEDGVWVDPVWGLPLLARRRIDGAPMLLVARVGRFGPLYFDRDPVSSGRYRTFMAATGAAAPPAWADHPPGDELPATCVSLEDAQAYAAWAGGQIPSEPLWALGGEQLGHAPARDRLALVRSYPASLADDFPCRWTVAPRGSPGLVEPGGAEDDWRIDLAARELDPLGTSPEAGRLGRIHEWTSTLHPWPSFSGTGDSWLDAPDYAEWDRTASRRSAPQASVVTGCGSARSPRSQPAGASPRDRDPFLGFRLVVVAYLPGDQALERPSPSPNPA